MREASKEELLERIATQEKHLGWSADNLEKDRVLIDELKERIAKLEAEIKTINHAVRMNSYDTNDAMSYLVRTEQKDNALEAENAKLKAVVEEVVFECANSDFSRVKKMTDTHLYKNAKQALSGIEQDTP